MVQAPNSAVWFITGTSRGLGRAFANAALEAGDRVVATARHVDGLADLHAAYPDNTTVLPLDVRDRSAVFATVQRAIAAYGRLDVVVNNAGHGLVGAVEEVTEHDARDVCDTNFFGPLWVTQAVLPHLRARRSGHIVQISTVGGVGTMPMMGLYNASKWALEAFSEALARELEALGIRVTIAELGGFATDWAWSSMKFSPSAPEYDELRRSVFGTAQLPWDMSKQAADPSEGNPADAARALLEHVKGTGARPLRLLVGQDALDHVRVILERRRDDYQLDPRFVWPK
jgi:NAD(P)-dependent dehydrogenase (short-subunit alcohol dehydrogenase family)